jgi:hypothetical protein
METCSVESGLLRKKPCGQAAVVKCVSCEQPLCTQHAVAQLTEAGKRSGKFMCPQCIEALKDHEKNLAAAARAQEDKKRAAMHKALMDAAKAPQSTPKKPVAPAPAAPEAASAAKPAEPEAIEFTPKDGKLEYTTRKPDDKGSDFKPD